MRDVIKEVMENVKSDESRDVRIHPVYYTIGYLSSFSEREPDTMVALSDVVELLRSLEEQKYKHW
ncbi:hypothetical protein [Sinanaerobacter chloroacetimidivorans]|uniref:Uncharacterized protein n=1 Tax=Sinanaerobacter chloroacetimidivorans TaxID=2818044 RepID=A0A8J8B0G6_9FIRM|nr:hypothetical protein [Sinanaerobacter chloroacetimidivorans]MBR0596606.1 hypothetical protein [Sinanaerobacter chloroacetimidivorans]